MCVFFLKKDIRSYLYILSLIGATKKAQLFQILPRGRYWLVYPTNTNADGDLPTQGWCPTRKYNLAVYLPMILIRTCGIDMNNCHIFWMIYTELKVVKREWRCIYLKSVYHVANRIWLNAWQHQLCISLLVRRIVINRHFNRLISSLWLSDAAWR